MLLLIFQNVERIGSPLLGIIIPSLIMFLSILFTWLLYKHFSEKK